jgi:4-hydroxybenzoate polyprenyltransferase
MSEYSDMVTRGWVARLPSRLRPYALVARLDRPIGVWLLFLPGLWSLALAARGLRLAWLVLLFGIGAVLMRGAGCVVNDMWDRELDRKVGRTAARPLASGTLAMRAAAWFLVLLLLAALLILLQLNRLAELLGIASLVLVALYPLAKRVTWWPQVMLGLTFGWGAPMGYAAASGRLDGVAGALYGAAICWILGYDTIYAHQDREDDALIGVRSTARLFARHTGMFLAVCYGATVLLLAVAGYLARLSAGFYAGLAVAAGMLAWQIARLDIDDKAGCLRLFKANRDVGLVVAVALLAGRL